MRKRLLSVFLVVLFVMPVYSQNAILVPDIINFSKKTYEAGNQNRSIGQDKRGLIYFANDDGLLVFDGTYWKTYRLPNTSIVRSLSVSGDTIYVGGQQEIGYFFFDPQGNLSYQSLKKLIPPGETEFTDVWRIVRFKKDIFFQSAKRIFRFHDGKITAFTSSNWRFLGTSRDLLIAQQYENGLVMFKDGKWLPLKNQYDFTKDKVALRSVVDFNQNETVITTFKSGVYIIKDMEIQKWETPSISAITTQIINTSCAIDSGLMVIATKLAGYYIINGKGETVQHITKKEGLQTNAVNTVFVDGTKNIWLGLDNGIDLVVNGNPIHHINPDPESKTPGYSAIVHNNQLYIGTGIGLYSIHVPADHNLIRMQGNFTMVKNSNGIVWGLSVVNDQLLMGHSDGAYIIKDVTCIPLDSTTGFFSFQPLTDQRPSPLMIAGTYNGVNLYNFSDGNFSNPKIHTFFESAKYMAIVDKDVWVAHPYLGLYKVELIDGKPVHKPYKDVNNILSSGHNHLFKLANKIVLVTRKGIFEYDKRTNDFIESEFFKRLFGSSIVSYLKEDAQGNIWFIQDKKPGVIDLSAPEKPVVTYFSELNNSVLGNDEEFIYPINKNNILIAGETGFYHIDYEKYQATAHALGVLLRTVTAFHQKDSILFGGYLPGHNSIEIGDAFHLANKISYKWNSIHFEFSSPYFGGVVEYACRLNGYEKEWSAWSKKAERSYTNLPEGNYVFEIKAKNHVGRYSPVGQFSFTISAPWYRTLVAYFIYVGLFMAVIYFFYKRQQKKYLIQQKNRLKKQQEQFNEEQKRLQYAHQLEIEKNEKEIIRLKNIKLEAEVKHNHAELASNTMTLLQKKELLNKIKEEILKVNDEPESEKKARNIRRIIKVIDEQLEMNDDWERFSQYFDRVNNDFLRILKETFPSLTPTDFKLCAYLRLNLTTKEIADLLNLSIRGVESSRYRLRKKLDLPNEVSLYDFLASIGGEQPHHEKSNGKAVHFDQANK